MSVGSEKPRSGGYPPDFQWRVFGFCLIGFRFHFFIAGLNSESLSGPVDLPFGADALEDQEEENGVHTGRPVTISHNIWPINYYGSNGLGI